MSGQTGSELVNLLNIFKETKDQDGIQKQVYHKILEFATVQQVT